MRQLGVQWAEVLTVFVAEVVIVGALYGVIAGIVATVAAVLPQ